MSRSNMPRTAHAAHPSNDTNGRYPTSQTKQTPKKDATHTGINARVALQPSRAPQNAHSAKKNSAHSVRRKKKSSLDIILSILLQSKKNAIICAMLLLCIGICVPLAVYGAASSDDISEADIDILSPDTDTLLSFEPELVYRDGEDTHLTEKDAVETTSSGDDKSSTTDTDEVPEESSDPVAQEPEMPADEVFAAALDAEPIAPPEPVIFNVTVSFYDRETLYCSTSETTLRRLLADNGIWLGENEHPSVDLDETLEYDTWIAVDKTEYASVTETEYIPYETDIINVTSIPRGTYQTVSEGQSGTRDTVYTVEYLNGVEVNRTEEYNYISATPVNEVCYYGTGGTFTASDGNVYSYSYCKNVRATYYNIYGTTASGMVTGPNVVATDPSVFPLGTQLYVMNDTFDLGVMTAADTGGAVQGDLIDIWMDGSCPYYELFASQGVWSMTVYVLD